MNRHNPLEEEILNILWSIDRGFPKEIYARLKETIPYNTFLSAVRKLEKEGHLAYNKFGRTHQYYPLFSKKEYSRSIFKDLLSNFFGGSREKLLSFFMEEEDLDASEIERILEKLKSNKND